MSEKQTDMFEKKDQQAEFLLENTISPLYSARPRTNYGTRGRVINSTVWFGWAGFPSDPLRDFSENFLRVCLGPCALRVVKAFYSPHEKDWRCLAPRLRINGKLRVERKLALLDLYRTSSYDAATPVSGRTNKLLDH